MTARRRRVPSPVLAAILALGLAGSIRFSPAQPTLPLGSAVNNGNGGVFDLDPAFVYTGPAAFFADTTVNANGAILRVSGSELIQALGGHLALNDATIEHASPMPVPGTFGFRASSPATARLSNVSIRGFAVGAHFLGAHGPQTALSGCAFAANSDNDILVAPGGNILIEACLINGPAATSVSLENASPTIRGNTFQASPDGAFRTGVLARVNSFANGAGGIEGNIFRNLSVSVHLAGLPGDFMAPRIAGNQFSHELANGAVFIRSRDSEPLVEENAFEGGTTAFEVTGASSYVEPGFSPSERPFRANQAMNQRGGIVVNLNDRAPDVLENTFLNTDTTIYIKNVQNRVLVKDNFLESTAFDEANINAFPQVGPGITVDGNSAAQIIGNHVDNFLGCIQIINNSQANVYNNFISRGFNGGLLVETGSSAWVVDNVGFRNRSDAFFAREATVAFIKNESRQTGQYAGNAGGASGIGVSNLATVPFLTGNFCERAKDPAFSVIEGAVVGQALSNTIRVSQAGDPFSGGVGFFVNGNASALAISGCHLFQGRDLFANTFKGPSDIQLFGCGFLGSSADGFAVNMNSGSSSVSISHSLFEDAGGSLVAAAFASPLRFERNVIGSNVAPAPFPCVTTGGGGRLIMSGNRLAALSGVGHTGSGPLSESTLDWWGAPDGPAPGGSGLSAQNISVVSPLAAPEGEMFLDGPLFLGAGQTRSGSFPAGGVEYEITPGRDAEGETLMLGRSTGLASDIAPLAGLVPGAIYTVVLPYHLWRDGSGRMAFAVDPGLAPPPFGMAGAVLMRYDALGQKWIGVPSRVEGSAVVYEWGGSDTPPPCGLFAIASVPPAEAASSWRAENHLLGLTPLRPEEQSATAAQNGDGQLNVADLIALVNAAR